MDGERMAEKGGRGKREEAKARARGVRGGEIKYYFPIKRYYLPLDETRRITEPISAFTLLFYSASRSLSFSSPPLPTVSPQTRAGRARERRNGNERGGVDAERGGEGEEAFLRFFPLPL